VVSARSIRGSQSSGPFALDRVGVYGIVYLRTSLIRHLTLSEPSSHTTVANRPLPEILMIVPR
jgi:hypothetical protein